MAGKFKGRIHGAVYTTREGKTGYHPDFRCSGDAAVPAPTAALAPSLKYLSFDGSQAMRCPISLDFLLGGRLQNECGAPDGASCRLPRKSKRVRKKRVERGELVGPAMLPPSATILGLQMDDDSHQDLGFWAFDPVNHNTMHSGLSYLERSRADFVCFQEARVDGDAKLAAERAAKRSKWSLAIEPAVRTPADGLSAGAAVAVRSHIGHSDPVKMPWHEELNSRVRVSWINAVCSGGFFLVSLYLWHSEGMSQRNLSLLQHLAWVLKRLRGPWIIGADWNLTPDVLRASGWLQLVKGFIRCTGMATCHASEYDFFVVSSGFDPMVVGVFLINDCGTFPHSPVRLWMRGRPRNVQIRALIPPKKIPAILPAGCLPCQAADGWDDIVDEGKPEEFGIDMLNISFTSWMSRVENCLADVMALSGSDRSRTCTRTQGTRIVFQPALGRPGSDCPRLSAITLAWKCLHSWISDVLVALRCGAPLAVRFKSMRSTWHIRYHDWQHLGGSTHALAFLRWVHAIPHSALACKTSLVFMHWITRTIAARATDYDCNRAFASYRAWLLDGPSQAGSKLHRMTRVQSGWIPSRVGKCDPLDADPDPFDPETDPDGLQDPHDLVAEEDLDTPCVAPLGGLAEADNQAESWGAEWGIGTDQPPVLWPNFDAESPLPSMVVQTIRSASDTFPAGTGLGWDKLHPRALGRLPDEALLALIRIFILAELMGAWPSLVGIVLVCLIPKTDGGRRPIGLLPSMIRLWMRVRLDVARSWQTLNERDFFYAGPAKGAAVASWKQAARAEYAASCRAIDYVANLLDLVKCFERVPHDWLVVHAIEYKYPLRLLKLSIAAYLLGRVIVVDGVCSYTLFAVRGITAGSVLATIELRVLLIKCMDTVISRFPSIDLTVYVDDTTLEAIGSPQHIVAIVCGATQCLADCFRQLRIELSPTKNLCCASRTQISDAVIRRLPGIKLRAASAAKSLGASIMAGSKRDVSIIKKRLSAFKQRITQFRKVRRTVGAKLSRVLLRTGGLPALVYGQANTGVSCSMLNDQRRSFAAAGVPAGAGDLDMTLAMIDGSPSGKGDPAFAAHADPIASWAESIWCRWLPVLMLKGIIAAAVNKLQLAKNTWACVRGPGAAFVASAKRLGWRVISALHVVDDRGNSIRFDRDSPAFVRSLVEQSVRRWRWRRVERKHPTLAQGDGGYGAHVLPLYKLVNFKRASSEDWNHEHVGALCSAICDRQWCQSRLVSAGLEAEANKGHKACRLCVAAGLCESDSIDPKFVGTLVHRYWVCPVLEPARCVRVPAYLRRKVNALLRRDSTLPPEQVLLYTRALHKSIEPSIAQPPREETFGWIVPPPPGGVAHGRVYADGSRLFAEHKYCGLVARQGWAFAIYDDEAKLIAAASGLTPWWASGIYAAELWALLNASQVAFPSSPFFIDCKAVQIGTRNGPSWANSPSRKLGRAWSPLALCLEDYPESATWVPAHCAKSAIGVARLSDGNVMQQVDFDGNDFVDFHAKKQARIHTPSFSDRSSIVSASNLVSDIAKWIGYCTVLANHFPMTLPDGSKKHFRDSLPGKRRKPNGSHPQPRQAKRGAEFPSPNSLSSVLQVPTISPARLHDVPPPPKRAKGVQEFFAGDAPLSSQARKRKQPSQRDFEDRDNATFHAYWRMNRDTRPPDAPPPVAANDRIAALRSRIAERIGRNGNVGNEASAA